MTITTEGASTIDIGPAAPDQLAEFMRVTAASFGHEIEEQDIARYESLTEADRTVGARDDGALIATAAALSFTLTVPGSTAAAAGVTSVGVLPSHRRRGVLTKMMRYQLDDIRDRGEALAILYASEGSIYGRFGYGLASLQGDIDIDRGRAVFSAPSVAAGRARLVDLDEATSCFAEVYDRIRMETPGMFARSPEWWRNHTLADPAHERQGRGPLFRTVIEIEGRAEAYALYRVSSRWEEGSPAGTLEVQEALGTSPDAIAEVWRFLFGIDLVAHVQAILLPADHPLLLLLAEPRRLRFRLADALYLRIVDVAGALSARSYAGEGSIVVELTDSFCPWNQGRWRLDADGSGATVTESQDDADIALDSKDLASVYLGGFAFRDLRRAGRLIESVPGAVRRADTLFATDRAPYCPEIF